MRKTLIGAAALTCFALTVALYLPIPGQIAMNVAYGDYGKCKENLPSDIVARTNGPYPYFRSELDCVAEYMDRKEAIRWRYFFFQTIATIY